MIRLFTFVFAASLLSAINSTSQTWVRSFYYDQYFGITVNRDSIPVGPVSIQQASDKSIYILNFRDQTNDYELMKFDSAGNFIWTKTVATSGSLHWQSISEMRITPDNGCLLYRIHVGNPPDDIDLIKINSGGIVIWQQTFSNFPYPVHIFPTFYNSTYLQFNDSLVELDANHNWVRGRSNFTADIQLMQDSDMIVADSVTISRQDFNGNFAWIDTLSGFSPFFADTSFCYFRKSFSDTIIKVNSANGIISWQKQIPGRLSVISNYDIISANGNNIIKYDSGGNVLWSKASSFPLFGFRCVNEVNGSQLITGGAFRCIDARYLLMNIGYSSFIASLDSSGNGVIDSTDHFFEGNANDNNKMGFADDAASIAVAMGASGYARDTALRGPVQHSWAVFCQDWPQSFGNGINYKYSDSDGNGIIDSQDILKLLSAFPYQATVYPHWRSSGQTGAELNVSITSDTIIPGDTLTAYIILGSTAYPIDSVYALSLTLGSNDLTMGGPAEIEILANQFGTIGLDADTFTAQNFATCQVNFLIYRTDHQNVFINGDTLARIRFRVTSSLWPAPVTLGCEATALTEKGFPVSLSVIRDSVYVPASTSINKIPENDISIYPNPTKDFLKIKSSFENFNYVIKDISGRIILTGSAIDNINTSALKAGRYFVELKAGLKTIHKEFTKVNR